MRIEDISPENPLAIRSFAGTRQNKGYEQITPSVAVGLSPPAGAKIAIIQAEGQNVRWRDDGTNPTATVGMLIEVGKELYYDGNLAVIKFIQATAGAKLNVSYYA